MIKKQTLSTQFSSAHSKLGIGRWALDVGRSLPAKK
jgi:hypothetical protein